MDHRVLPAITPMPAFTSSGGSRPGPGGLGPLTFRPAPSFSTDYLLLRPMPLIGRSGVRPPESVFWLEPPLFTS